MSRYFHVDRLSRLQQGQTINLARLIDVTPNAAQEHLDVLFADGVSLHGQFYLFRKDDPQHVARKHYEIIFEYVRRAYFQERPSRFSSFFGMDTLVAAQGFFAKHGVDALGDPMPYTIWEIECANPVFKADMRLISEPLPAMLGVSMQAHQYWSGVSPNDEPVWEVLMPLPITVVRQVE